MVPFFHVPGRILDQTVKQWCHFICNCSINNNYYNLFLFLIFHYVGNKGIMASQQHIFIYLFIQALKCIISTLNTMH
jgi:hypothetical protein